jgi:hypothetical protein
MILGQQIPRDVGLAGSNVRKIIGLGKITPW